MTIDTAVEIYSEIYVPVGASSNRSLFLLKIFVVVYVK